MTWHLREMEGDANQRRQAARDARATGTRPSAQSATLGASDMVLSIYSHPPMAVSARILVCSPGVAGFPLPYVSLRRATFEPCDSG